MVDLQNQIMERPRQDNHHSTNITGDTQPLKSKLRIITAKWKAGTLALNTEVTKSAKSWQLVTVTIQFQAQIKLHILRNLVQKRIVHDELLDQPFSNHYHDIV
jgi:hypothetical protein